MLKPFQMRTVCLVAISAFAGLCLSASANPLAVADVSNAGDLILFDGAKVAPIFVDTNANEAVLRAANDLAVDFARAGALGAGLRAAGFPAGRAAADFFVAGFLAAGLCLEFAMFLTTLSLSGRVL